MWGRLSSYLQAVEKKTNFGVKITFLALLESFHTNTLDIFLDKMPTRHFLLSFALVLIVSVITFHMGPWNLSYP